MPDKPHPSSGKDSHLWWKAAYRRSVCPEVGGQGLPERRKH